MITPEFNKVFTHLVFASLCTLVFASCDQIRQITSKKESQTKETVEVTETTELSMESLIDQIVTKSNTDVEQAHKHGHKNVVGYADGKWWVASERSMQLGYIKAVGDLVSALGDISLVAMGEIFEMKQSRNLEVIFGDGNSLNATHRVESQFTARIATVVSGRTYGDLETAVTKFYRDKPLLKDKPVLWVLAVHLYKELEDTKPTDKKTSYLDVVKVPMKKIVK